MVYATTTMSTSKKRYEVFENFAKEMGATFSTNLSDLSEGERSLLEEFARHIHEINTVDDPLFTPGERFRLLADTYNLSVDEGDIELFLTVELSRLFDKTTLTKKTLASDTAMRDQATERALNRVLTGIQYTGISEPHQRELRESGAEAASDILDAFKPSILKNHTVNILREDLMDIYERFLLWMRMTRDGMLALSTRDRHRVEALLKKMIDLLNLAYVLNEPTPSSDPLVQRLIASSDARMEQTVVYTSALKELESIMPSRQKSDDNWDWLDI
ncbi:hypothetical protein SPIROBIBN47_180022 [uncultured spirochete]|uniref:Uncharacterized protein n=2 Tax=Spirochaetales TaxID=136 RepID=A0A3P3XGI1_9SPIR|nr:hypothetical protein SPIROBIBN47_180022 [uncultured spirochete]